MSVTDGTGIHVGDPAYCEEVRVTRGEHSLHFVKYEGDTRYVVLDEFGDFTSHTWSGDISGISDFQSIAAMFDDVYGGKA